MRRWLSLCRLLSAAELLGEAIGYLMYRRTIQRKAVQ